MQNQSKPDYNVTQRKLGVIHSLLLRDIRKWMDAQSNGKPVFLYDIRNQIETTVMRVLKSRSGRSYDAVYQCMAFPVGVNKNSVAAHYSPCDWEQETLDMRKDSVSIDFGLYDPTTGVLTDGAFTWNGSENKEAQQLTRFAEGAVDTIIQQSGADVILGQLGQDCQEYIESQEVVLEGIEQRKSVTVLSDLCGHKISPYMIHAGKAVPTIGLPNYTKRMEDGESYAIEVFPTTGNGKTVEVPETTQVPSHLSLEPTVIQELKKAPKQYVSKMIQIVTTRKCVPFHPEWYNIKDEMVLDGIKDSYWKSYPAIRTMDGSTAVQWEKMIKVTDSGTTLLVQA